LFILLTSLDHNTHAQTHALFFAVRPWLHVVLDTPRRAREGRYILLSICRNVRSTLQVEPCKEEVDSINKRVRGAAQLIVPNTEELGNILLQLETTGVCACVEKA
jgi:hypothetical protein